MLSPSGSRVFTVQVAEVSELGPPVWRPKASLRVYRGFGAFRVNQKKERYSSDEGSRGFRAP